MLCKSMPRAVVALAMIFSLTGCATGEGKSKARNVVNPNINAPAAAVASPLPDSSTQDESAFPVRGEVNQTYQLSPGAQVEISGVEGPIEVETSDENSAQIHLIRMARTQADYDCEKVDIQHTPGNLVLTHQQNRRCQVIHSRERLKLVVPRSANLSFRRIEGDLTIGVTNGVLRLNNIEGFVRVASAQSAEIKSVEKGLSLNVNGLGPQGINISQVEGSVELGLMSGLNADLRISGYSGEVKSEIPDAQVSASGRRGYRARLGSGGKSIFISHIEGDVKIRRL